MKLGIMSDLHIYPWETFSSYDKEGVPSRLSLYIDLANLAVETFKAEGCDVIVLSGDILNTASNKPMTLNIAKQFLEILSGYCTVIMTDGQHDMDTKSSFSRSLHSIVSLFDKAGSNIIYAHNDIINLEGTTKFYVRGWDPSGIVLEEDADVFIGHGIVEGSSTPDGYTFHGGIPATKLLSKYKLSIVGDIHNSKTFTENGRVVLIPGSPIQNSFKDQEVCGIWTADLTDRVDLKFHRITGAPFHRFITRKSSELTEAQDQYTHIRLLKDESTNKSTKNKEFIKQVDHTDLSSILKSELHLLKPVDADGCEKIIQELLENNKVEETKFISNVRLKKIKIFGFGNITNFELDLTKLPSPLLLVGPNGSGKSTLIGAIYWALTGYTTKKIRVGQIANRNQKEGCYVQLTLDRDGQEFTILRSRDHQLYGTSLSVLNGSSFEKSSMAETQDLIQSIIGVKSDTLLSTCYLSSRDVRIFGELTETNKYDLVGLLANVEIVEKLRTYSTELKSKAISDRTFQSGNLSALERQISNLQTKITGLENTIKSRSVSSIETVIFKFLELTKATFSDINTVGTYSLSDNLSLVYDQLNKKLLTLNQNLLSDIEKLELKIQEYQSSISTTNNEINNLSNTISKAKHQILQIEDQKTCPTCNQSIKSEDGEKIIKSFDLDNLTQRLMSLYSKKLTYENQLQSLQPVHQDALKQKKEKDDITVALNAIKGYQLSLKELEVNKEEIVLSDSKTELESLSSTKQSYELQVQELTKTEANYKLVTDNLLGKTGPVIRRLVQDACRDLTEELSQLLSSSNYKVEINIVGTKITPICYINGITSSYEELSDGEKQSIDLAMLIAFNNLLSRKYKQDNGILGSIFLDEVFSYLDSKNVELAWEILQRSVAGLVIVVTHDDNLKVMFTNKIVVSKENNNARYQIIQ